MAVVPENTAVVIAAAGNSGRMGIPKTLLMTPDGKTFLEHILGAYFSAGIETVVVVVNPTIFKIIDYRKPFYFNDVTWVINPEPEKGRMLSLSLGLQKVTDHEFCFIQNVDQPFATAELLMQMMHFANHDAYIVPVFNGKSGHPVLLNRKIHTFLCQEYNKYENLRLALENFERFCLETDDPMVCENINTPEDYEHAFGVKLKE